LLRKFGPLEGPLTMSALHDARMHVAALMRDVDAVEHHAACMQRWQRVTNVPSLIAYGVLSVKRARETAGCPSPQEPERAEAPGQQPLTIVHRIRHGGERSLHESAAWILDQLSAYADLRAGHVFRWEDERLTCVASRGVLPEPAVFELWLLQRLWNDNDADDEADEDDQATVHFRLDPRGGTSEDMKTNELPAKRRTPDIASAAAAAAAAAGSGAGAAAAGAAAAAADAEDPDEHARTQQARTAGRRRPDPDTFVAQDRTYRMVRLVTSPSSGSRLVGVLVLSEETQCEIPPSVLRVIAERVEASAGSV
jgi:hypothetical protein